MAERDLHDLLRRAEDLVEDRCTGYEQRPGWRTRRRLVWAYRVRDRIERSLRRRHGDPQA